MNSSILRKLRASLPVLCLAAVQTMSAASISFTSGGTVCPGQGLCTSRAGATTIDFNGLDGQLLPQTFGIATFTGSGSSPFVTGSVANQYAAPVNDTSTYLTTGSPNRPNPIEIAFSAPIAYYGFYLGSPDTYNSISFYSNGSLVQSFTGGQLVPPGDGNQSVSRFVNFDVVGGSVNRIVLSSSSAAMETDNHAYVVSAVPEPTSMILAGAGLAAVVAARRARRK